MRSYRDRKVPEPEKSGKIIRQMVKKYVKVLKKNCPGQFFFDSKVCLSLKEDFQTIDYNKLERRVRQRLLVACFSTQGV